MKESRKVEGLWSIVLVELTNCCNFSCSFCPIDITKKKKTTMPRELWQKILKELGEKKMARTVFFHLLGEPLLHRDIFEAIKYANDLGLAVSLYTNGALLDEEKGELLLTTLKKGRVVLSLQEVSPELFEQRCHGSLTWETYIKRLQDFILKSREYNVPIQIHYMVDVQGFGWNIIKILGRQKLIQKVYDDWVKILNPDKKCKVNVLNPAGVYELADNISFYVKHEGQWSNQFIGEDMEVVKSNKGHCDLMTDTFAILADGTCTYCCSDYNGELNIGNANEDSLENIFYNEKSEMIRKAEREGKMTEDVCKVCRGRLVYKDTKKTVPSRNLITEYFFFKEHLDRYGIASAMRKTVENLRRRIIKYKE